MSHKRATDDLWIVVHNWDEFQHYKDRDPVWIRVYRDLHHKDEYLELTRFERSLLIDVWLAFAATNGQLRVRHAVATTAPRERRHVATRHFERLEDSGFISLVASKPLPQRQRQRQKGLGVTSKADVAANTNNQSRDFRIPKNLLREVPR